MTTTRERVHAIPAALSHAREAIAAVGQVEPLFMSPDELEAGLREVAALKAQAAELEARLVATADVVLDDARRWIHLQTRTGVRETRALIRSAHALQSHPAVAAGMRAGEVSAAQAEVIIDAVEALPNDLDQDLVALAETILIADADEFDPHELRRLGRRVLEVVAPEIAEAYEAAALAEQERRAREKTRLTLKNCGDGTYRLSGRIPELTAALLATFLSSLTNPRREPDWAEQATTDAGIIDSKLWWTLPGPIKLGHAFCEFLERINPKHLPTHGSSPVTLIVTIGLEKLQQDLAAATVNGPDGPFRLSAGEARRLACTAGIIPAVLGSRSEVLDLGRTARLFSTAQKRALTINQPTCNGEGCEIPAVMTEAHHHIPWAEGGPTDLAEGRLYCGRDHDRVHSADWLKTPLPNGTMRFTRRT